MTNDRRAFVAATLLAAAGAAPAAMQQPGDDPQASPIWQKVRASLFEGRPVETAPPGLLVLEAPARAVDAAVVPVAIRTRPPAGRWVQRLVLVIDANPSPISAIFQFTRASGRAEVETRVRVDEYSFVRAIAEMDDGRLYSVHRFVKASGGCSAPAGADAAAAMASLGRMRMQVVGEPKGGQAVQAQLAISHPNHSGLAMDQATRQFTPAHFVRKVDVSYGGQNVFSADVDFSIAENPNFRFWFVPAGGSGELRATVVDSWDKRFEAVQPLREPAP